jgi:hypothetical protein
MVLNRFLDAEELNVFGHCADLQYFKNVSDVDFEVGGTLRFYSSND